MHFDSTMIRGKQKRLNTKNCKIQEMIPGKFMNPENICTTLTFN